MVQLVDLQKRHTGLLALQKQPPADFQHQVEAFIQELSEAGRSIYPAQERDQLRSFIRYWASVLYDLDRGQGYNVVDLQVYSGLQPSLVWQRYRWAIIAGAIIAGTVLVVFVLGSILALWNNGSGPAAGRTATAAALLEATSTPSAMASSTFTPSPSPTNTPTPDATLEASLTPTISLTPVVYGPVAVLERPSNGESILPETTFSGPYANLNPGWSIHVILQSVTAAGRYYPLESFYTIPPSQPNKEWKIEANLGEQFNPEQADTYIVTLVIANTEAIRNELS